MAVRALPRRMRYGEEATLVEHLGELRARLVISLLTIAVGFGVAFAFNGHIIDWLKAPLPPGKELITIGVTEPFFTSIKISLYTALAAGLPIILYQLWSFLAPAIRESSQRVVAVFAALGGGLFAGGIAFAYYVVLPRAIDFLTNFNDEQFEIQIRASYYFSFVVTVLIGISLVFELPIFILALVRLRILTADRLRRNRRLGIVLVFLVAILLPTVDPISLAFEVVPLLVLFEASIWAATYMERRWERSGKFSEYWDES